MKSDRFVRICVVSSLGIAMAASSARGGIDPSDGAIVLDDGGVVAVQVIHSDAGYRNVLSLDATGLDGQTVTSPTGCGAGDNLETYAGKAIPNCAYDTGYCSGAVTGTGCRFVGGLGFNCICEAARTIELGTFTAGTRLNFWDYVNNPGITGTDTVDYLWKPSGTTNPNPDGFKHLRTTQFATDLYLLEWEDLPQSFGSSADQNDLIVLVRITPAS